jgi:hypothetical protein
MILKPVNENFRGIGDCQSAKGHETYGFIFDTEQEAQKLSNRVCDHFKIDRWNIEFMESRAKYLMGTANDFLNLIKLRPKGQTVGCLLHEIAHRKGYKHDWEFQRFQTQILKYWDDEIRPNVKIRWADPTPIKFGQAKPVEKPKPVEKLSADEIEERTEVVLDLIEDHASESFVSNKKLVAVSFVKQLCRKYNIESEFNFIFSLIKDDYKVV